MSKYLTYEERLEIEGGLKKNLSFGAIANLIGKDRTTIAKEVKNTLFRENPAIVDGHITPVNTVAAVR